MARPGFVLEVDDRTPPLVVCHGDEFRAERLPLGARVVYPSESAAAPGDPSELIDAALESPLESAPLANRLRPGMRLTVAFDDITNPVPPLRGPDLRGRIIEAVLTRAAAAGVDDVVLIAARGLNRRMTDTELHSVLGERVFRSFFADGRLTQHDAEDELVALDGDGPELAINARVAQSDLLVFVHLATRPDDGTAVAPAGLGSTATVTDGQHPAAGEAVGRAVPTFLITAVLDNATWSGPLELLGRREWEWNLPDRARWTALSRGLPAAPRRTRRRLLGRSRSGYRPVAVYAGEPGRVAAAGATKLRETQAVEVAGAADVGLIGVPHLTPYSVGSVTNPLLAAWQGLAATFGAHTGQPFVRAGGALVLYAPLTADFSPLHHPSYVDFFAALATDGSTAAGHGALPDEATYAADPWYRHLYRTSYAFHGVHPFLRWRELAAARAHCSELVWVGADREVAGRLGFRAASTLADALEIVVSAVGRSPSITYLRTPPALITDVR